MPASTAATMSHANDEQARIPLKDRLIVALDVPTVEQAEKIVATLGDAVSFYKVGLQLQFAAQGAGLRFTDSLLQRGKHVFLDAKLYDIQETVERAVENIARLGVTFLTVHGDQKTLPAALKGRGDKPLKILSVTVLTSLDAKDLADLGYTGMSVRDLVLRRTKTALDLGADGVIASAEEASAIRELAGSNLAIVTPGIRRTQDAVNDQKRIATPAGAIAAGSDHLVVGRPITRAPDQRRAAEEILEEMAGALP
jgi:orotidine-5'-phosphate decarboxylase